MRRSSAGRAISRARGRGGWILASANDDGGSNDSDMEPALRMIREDVPAVKVGVILPLRGGDAEGKPAPANKRLLPHAHWVRHYIRDDELQASQLPQNVQTKKKPASKPPHW